VNDTGKFGDAAQRLARNPLGIIALFIVLVYGLAALVTTFSGSMSPAERLPLVYFLVIFPVLVLGVFAWLVGRHSNKLFSPQDFKDEENYVKLLSATASLTVASIKHDKSPTESDLGELVRTVRDSAGRPHFADQVLWVDDRPDNNLHERRALEAMGLNFTLSRSTTEALGELSRREFGAIISDMGRREGPREGYLLLEKVRQTDQRTPYFIYAGEGGAEHERDALSRGAQGNTNNAQELFRMVMRAVVKR
jgi:CheY-like chemotaxis protein